jgi:hypothetical protein
MTDIISKLTAQQALTVVQRLAGKGGEIGAAVRAEAIDLLGVVDLGETADEVLAALDSIAIEDCWDRAGGSRDGYTSPEEAAAELMEEELEPYVDQVERYHELGMPQQEAAYCMGVILGIYQFDRESKSEFRELAEDAGAECAETLLDGWRKRNQDKASVNAMREFMRERCPKWAKWLEDKRRS